MPIVRDRRVITWASKIGGIDKDTLSDLATGESAYYVVCMSPQTRWLLLSLVAFIEPYKNRWLNFSDVREIDQLIAETNDGLICPMACQEDILAIIAALETISDTLVDVRDRIGGTEADIDVRLTEIKAEIADLDTTLGFMDIADLLDKLEPILNGVGIILGAPDVPLNGA